MSTQARTLQFMVAGPSDRRLRIAFGLSLLLHLIFFLAVRYHPPEPRPVTLQMDLLPPEPTELAVSQPQTPQVKRQMVSPSESPERKPPPETNKLSDKDSATEVETIKRGLPGLPRESVKDSPAPNAPAPSAKKAQEPRRQEKPPQEKAEPRKAPPPVVKSLRLSEQRLEDALQREALPQAAEPTSDERLRDYITSGSTSAESKGSDAEREKSLKEYEPFRRRSLSSFLNGNNGSADYLPDIPDGEMTMLNAKADRHAVFVRRVALQVFGALRSSSWADLSYQGAKNIGDFAVVHATMSPKGKLLSVELESSSGVKKFDGILKHSAETGAWDQNPPPSAQGNDGNIHFIFQARTWARRAGEGQFEQRWLLLGTGLL